MFKATLTLTRKDNSVLWEDPRRSIGAVLDVLSEAANRNISVAESFSPDVLTRKLVWSAPSEEVWDEFSQTFLLRGGKIDDSWYIENDITYEVTRENIDE